MNYEFYYCLLSILPCGTFRKFDRFHKNIDLMFIFATYSCKYVCIYNEYEISVIDLLFYENIQ